MNVIRIKDRNGKMTPIIAALDAAHGARAAGT